MGVSMAAFTTFIEQFSDVLWNSLLLFLLVGTGVYFTVRLRGVQVRRFGEGFRRVFGGFTLRGKKADAEGMSSFQALTTAIAAQVGTGNITGCATALVSGGPGALFWTWVSAFFGMATIYAEAVLAQHYKTTVNGQVTGGPTVRATPSSTEGVWVMKACSASTVPCSPMLPVPPTSSCCVVAGTRERTRESTASCADWSAARSSSTGRLSRPSDSRRSTCSPAR